MRKAVVWLCWSERSIAEAVTSAISLTTCNVDRVVITDLKGEVCARKSGVFSSVIATDFSDASELRKSRLADVFPKGYDAILYLDCNSILRGDINFGFDMAERYGIAIPTAESDASAYSKLDELAIDAGLKPATLVRYSTRAVFIFLSPQVKQVLARWRALGETIVVMAGVAHDDDALLTLAFEQLEYRPYILSPLFCKASGKESLPLPVSHQPPGPQQLPRALLRPKFLGDKSPSIQMSLSAVRTALAVRREFDSRQALEYLIGRMGMEVSSDLDDAYLDEALNYHLGLLFAYAREPEKMAECISESHTMPAPDDDLLFSDHVNLSRQTNDHQIRAIACNIPPILFSCMPRSASATFTHILGQVLDIPVLHLSVGHFPNYFLAPSWLDMFLEGGAITQDHFGPNDFNVGVLSGRGERDLFVLIRDPRAAARSYVHYTHGTVEVDRSLEARIEHVCVSYFIPWLQGWIDCSKTSSFPMRIHWITYKEVAKDPAAALRKVVRVLQERHPMLSRFATYQSVPDVKIHYGTADDEKWRTEVGDITRERLWLACTPDIRSVLTLAP